MNLELTFRQLAFYLIINPAIIGLQLTFVHKEQLRKEKKKKVHDFIFLMSVLSPGAKTSTPYQIQTSEKEKQTI